MYLRAKRIAVAALGSASSLVSPPVCGENAEALADHASRRREMSAKIGS
jgi:hypothetical protein